MTSVLTILTLSVLIITVSYQQSDREVQKRNALVYICISYQYSYLCVQWALLSSCVSLCDVFGFSIVLPPWNIIILRKWGRRQRVLEDCCHLLILKFTHRVLSETWNFYTLYTFAKLQMYILLSCLLHAFKNGPESLGLFFGLCLWVLRGKGEALALTTERRLYVSLAS